MSRIRVAAIALVIIAIGSQFVRPARTNPGSDASQGIDAHVTIPPDTRAILQRACGDCHSNETRWPWYSNLAPTSWFVINHVNDGRRALNLDDWNAHNRRATSPPFDRICHDIRDGDMPLWNYLLVHRDARLSPADIDNLCTWANGVSSR